MMFQGAVLVKNLAAKEPSAHGLDAYYKQYYPCLSAAAATIKWYSQELWLASNLTGRKDFNLRFSLHATMPY